MVVLTPKGPWEAGGPVLGVGLALRRRLLDRAMMLVGARRAEEVQRETAGRHGNSTMRRSRGTTARDCAMTEQTVRSLPTRPSR